MQTDRQAGKMLVSKPTGLSVQRAIDGYHFGQRQYRQLLTEASILGAALDQLGAAIQTVQTDNSSAEQQALVDASRQLSLVLEGRVS